MASVGTWENDRSAGLSQHLAKLWGGAPNAPLEEKMMKAAAAEALSLAWLSGTPQQTFPGLLETKVREAKAYLRRQAIIKGKTDRIISLAF